MDQEEIDALAAEIFEANTSQLTQMLVFFNYLSAQADEKIRQTVYLSGIILVSGNSMKAARYREVTGNSINREEIVCCPIIAATPEESVLEYRKWLGDEALPLLATGNGRPIIIFVGSGFSVNFIDLKQFTTGELQQILKTAAAEFSKEVDVSDPNYRKEFSNLARGQDAFLRQLRKPTLDTD